MAASGYMSYPRWFGDCALSKVERQGTLPFFLVHDLDAILLADLIWNSPRVEQYNESEANEARWLEIDSAEEIKLNALFQSARYLQGQRQEHAPSYLSGQRSSSQTYPEYLRTPQATQPLGRPLHHLQSYPARFLQVNHKGW